MHVPRGLARILLGELGNPLENPWENSWDLMGDSMVNHISGFPSEFICHGNFMVKQDIFRVGAVCDSSEMVISW